MRHLLSHQFELSPQEINKLHRDFSTSIPNNIKHQIDKLLDRIPPTLNIELVVHSTNNRSLNKYHVIKFDKILFEDFHHILLKNFEKKYVTIPNFLSEDTKTMTIDITESHNKIHEMLIQVRDKMIPACLALMDRNMIKQVLVTYTCLSYCDGIIKGSVPKFDVISTILMKIYMCYDLIHLIREYAYKEYCAILENYIGLITLSCDFTLDNIDLIAYFDKYIALLKLRDTNYPNDMAGTVNVLLVTAHTKTLQYYYNMSENQKQFLRLKYNIEGDFVVDVSKKVDASKMVHPVDCIVYDILTSKHLSLDYEPKTLSEYSYAVKQNDKAEDFKKTVKDMFASFLLLLCVFFLCLLL